MRKMTPLTEGNSATFNIYAELPHLLLENSNVALATVTGTKGSAPQKTGNSAIFDKNKLVAGTIGGGIVEFSVQERIKEMAGNRHSAFHFFNLTNEPSDQEGAICGGTMEILLDAEPEKHIVVFKAVKESLKRREPGLMVTGCLHASNGQLKISREWITLQTIKSKAVTMSPEIYNIACDMLNSPVKGSFRRIDFDKSPGKQKGQVFLESVVPFPRLIIAGAGHIGKALSHLGKMLGFEVYVWDYRGQYAAKELLPDADVILSGPIDASLAKVETDRNTYIVAVTTGHKYDTEVLRTFIGSPAGYIGMIGSRKKTLLMGEQFRAEGWATGEQWNKVHAPIGLDIGSETVEEIAVSIAAQLIQVRHQINKTK